MFIQNGRHGYIASDFVANAINFYMSRKYGKPFERYPTPRVRFAKNLPVDETLLNAPVVDPVPGVSYPYFPLTAPRVPKLPASTEPGAQ
jgi:hypothetical protein